MGKERARNRTHRTAADWKGRSPRNLSSDSSKNPSIRTPLLAGKPALPGQVRWLCVALIALNLIVHASVRHHGFVNYDDDDYVTANAVVQHGLTWDGVSWAFTTGHAANWHPLTWLSHML